MAADDKKLANASQKVVTGFENVASMVGGRFSKVLGGLADELGTMAKTFQDLSNTGNAFNNDMLGMRVAAANARMSLEEYAKVVEANGKAFTGLGGSVSQGTKVFGEFSKAFFESGLTENLRQMGYTSKDLNELLAVQIGFQKSTTDTTVDGQMRTAKAAAELGAEMDLVAKLTGVSRREQEEKLKKAQVDGQVEAKFRMIGIEQGAEAEKAARENYAKQMLAAEAMGQGQLFKEFFATGTATSKDAQMQLALLGDSSLKTAESATALSNANIEASKSAMESAKQYNMANQSNMAILSLAATGIGDAGKAAIKNVQDNDVAYQGLKKFMKGTDDVVEAMKLQKDAIIKEQGQRNALTETMITAQRAYQDSRAGVVSSLGRVARDSEQSRDPTTGKATGALAAAQDLARKVPGGTGGKTNEELAKDYVESNGKNARNLGTMIPDALEKRGFFDTAKKIDQGLITLINQGAEWLPKLEKAIKEIKGIKDEGKPSEVKKRQGGSIEMAGTMFEDWGKGTMAELHGLETVMKPDQMMNFAKGMGQQGASTAFNNMKGLLAGQEKGTTKGIDLGKLGSDIKTTVSKVEIINWPKDLISKVEVKVPAGGAAKPETKPAEQTTTEQDKAKAEAEAKEREKKAAEDRRKEEEQEAKFRMIGIRDGAEAEKKARDDYTRQRAQQETANQSRTEKAAKAAEEVTIKSGDTLTSLAKRYGTTVAELMKANPAIKDANKIVAGAKLTIPGQEKKVIGDEDAAKKAQSEAEQAQIKQHEQEKKFRQIGIEKGEEAEKKAREDYTRQKAQEESITNSREDELKARIIGIREGTDAEKKFRDTLKQQNLEGSIKKFSETKVTVNGKDVDPNSKEGQAAIKQMDAVKANLENSVGNMLNLTKIGFGDLAKTNLTELKNAQTKISDTKITVNGKNVDPNSAEGQAALKQMDAVRANLQNTMGNMLNLTKTGLSDLAKTNLTEFKNAQIKTSETKVTVNGKDVDPNSKEGQSVVKEMEESRDRLEKIMSNMMSGVVEKKRTEPRERREEPKISEMPNFDKFIEKLQGKTPQSDESRKAQLELNKISKEYSDARSALRDQMKEKLGPSASFGEVRKAMRESQEGKDIESKFGPQIDALRKKIYEGTSAEVEKRTEQLEAVRKISSDELDLVTGSKTKQLEQAKAITQVSNDENKRSMSLELESEKFLQETLIKSKQNLNKDIEALQTTAKERELTNFEKSSLKILEQQRQYFDEQLKESEQHVEKIKKELSDQEQAVEKSANSITNIYDTYTEQVVGTIGGMTDAAIAAQDAFMQEINTLFDMPVDAAAEAQDALMQEANALFDMPVDAAAEHQQALLEEANALFDMPSEAVADAQDAFMQEANALFDMPERDEFVEDEYGEGGEAIGGEMDSAFAEDEYGALEDLTNQIQGLKEFEQDEYGEGGEDVTLPEEPEEDYISLAMKDFADQVAGLKEFEQDEYGEGGEDVTLPEEPEEDYVGLAMKEFADQVAGLKEFEQDEYGEGGEDVTLPEEPEEDYVGLAMKEFASQVPDMMEYSDDMRAGEDIKPIATGTDSMADDAAFAAGPGDASVAGIDVAPAMNDLTKSLPQAQPLSAEPPKSKPQYSKIDMGGFTLGPDGLPIAKPKAQGQAAANAVKQEKDNKKEEDKKAAEAKKSEPDKKDKDSAKKEGEGDKPKKTLDDVVKSLDQLNMNIGKLTSKVEESAKQQVQATKSLNGNLYNV